ncbi:hypothetical protein Ddc_14721 [Ditylenchus destructor]|nr:hypothetical protein Ddc_14721 [Ditylenchus destructor]
MSVVLSNLCTETFQLSKSSKFLHFNRNPKIVKTSSQRRSYGEASWCPQPVAVVALQQMAGPGRESRLKATESACEGDSCECSRLKIAAMAVM